jgi:hypothetical protein
MSNRAGWGGAARRSGGAARRSTDGERATRPRDAADEKLPHPGGLVAVRENWPGAGGWGLVLLPRGGWCGGGGAVRGVWVRAARDAGRLWDASPLKSLAPGP